MMVNDPPSSVLRAAPKICLGTSSARESIPPDIVRPEFACFPDRLNARPSRVSESSTINTCSPFSTMIFAFSSVCVDNWMCRSSS